MRGNEQDRWMTAEEAATYLGYVRRTIYELVREKDLPHKRIGRTLRFRRSDLDRWIEEQTRDHPNAA
jgi:excisionase family DNA binding protein